MIEIQLLFNNGQTKNVRVNSLDKVNVLYQYSPESYFLCGEKFLYDDYRLKMFGLKSGDQIRVFPLNALPSLSDYCKSLRANQSQTQLMKINNNQLKTEMLKNSFSSQRLDKVQPVMKCGSLPSHF